MAESEIISVTDVRLKREKTPVSPWVRHGRCSAIQLLQADALEPLL